MRLCLQIKWLLTCLQVQNLLYDVFLFLKSSNQYNYSCKQVRKLGEFCFSSSVDKLLSMIICFILITKQLIFGV